MGRPQRPGAVRMSEALQRLRGIVAEAENYSVRSREEERRSLSRLVSRAREGALGPEWERLAPRLERGETTPRAIFSGEDTSREAAVLRERAAAATEQFDLAEAPAEDEELEAELAENWAAMVAARKRLRHLRQRAAGGVERRVAGAEDRGRTGLADAAAVR